MSTEGTRELLGALPILVAIFASGYLSAMVCRGAGLYIDGGVRGWLCVLLFLLGWALYFSLMFGALWLAGALPEGVFG